MPEEKRAGKKRLVFGRKKFTAKEQAAEGVTIALSAVRLAVKNAILMRVLGERGVFEAGNFVEVAKEALTNLAEQSEREAERARVQLKLASRRHESPDSSHDYSSLDVSNLRRRAKQAQRVAEALLELVESEEPLLALVEQSRLAAWDEVSWNIAQVLDFVSDAPDADPNYEQTKAARIQNLQLVDLPRLAARKRSAVRVRNEIAKYQAPDSQKS